MDLATTVIFQQQKMREGTGGMKYIYDIMIELSAKHELHLSVYEDDNETRLTGTHSTPRLEKFSFSESE